MSKGADFRLTLAMKHIADNMFNRVVRELKKPSLFTGFDLIDYPFRVLLLLA